MPAQVAEQYGSRTVDALMATVLGHYDRLWPRVEIKLDAIDSLDMDRMCRREWRTVRRRTGQYGGRGIRRADYGGTVIRRR